MIHGQLRQDVTAMTGPVTPGRGRASIRRRRLLGIGVGLAGVAILLAAGDVHPSTAGRTVQVKALWYGEATDGSIQAGVTPVGITASYDDPSTPLLVDVGGLRAAGAGPMWTAATAVAEVQAVLIAGVDPRLVQVSYSLKEAIDGPSAGGLLSAGSLAAIRGVPLSRDTTMTGTVLPDGSIGPVSGIPDKIRAAEAAGYSRVLVPVGPGRDLRTGAPVDLAALGRSLGVEVIPVKSVPEAYELLTRTPDVARPSEQSPIAPGVLSMLDRRSRVLTATATGELQTLAVSSDPATWAALPDIRTWLRAAERASAEGDAILAFAGAAEAVQAIREVAAVDLLHRQAERAALPALVAQVRRDSARSRTAIQAEVRATADMPLAHVEQVSALPDALAWGVFAMTSMDVAAKQLATVRTQADLDRIVRFIETARFEAANNMAATAEALRYIGRRPVADAGQTARLLDGYADLIAYGAEANGVYAESLRPAADQDSFLRQLIQGSHQLTAPADAADPDAASLRQPTARPALRLAAALLEYVETTQLVNDLTSRPTPGTDVPPNVLPIKDPAVVARQASTAADLATDQIHALTAAGLDPSYVQWNSRWGEQLSFGRLPEITDEQTLHGLEYQWFAVLQGRQLMALGQR